MFCFECLVCCSDCVELCGDVVVGEVCYVLVVDEVVVVVVVGDVQFDVWWQVQLFECVYWDYWIVLCGYDGGGNLYCLQCIVGY